MHAPGLRLLPSTQGLPRACLAVLSQSYEINSVVSLVRVSFGMATGDVPQDYGLQALCAMHQVRKCINRLRLHALAGCALPSHYGLPMQALGTFSVHKYENCRPR